MSVLNDLLIGVQEDLRVRQERVTLEELQVQAQQRDSALSVESMLRAEGTVKVIAEVKRSSPSKGALAAIADPCALAQDYEAGGATMISVLTEERKFGGSLEDLAAVRKAVDCPLLRKDFVVSAYQVWEARAVGADAVLLIVAALEQEALISLIERVASLGMMPLVEVHDEEEVERALAAGAKVIGVNARNLKTLEVDRGVFARLSPQIPADIVQIAESGVRGPHDVIDYGRTGAHAVLVGEALVTGNEPRQAVADMVAAGSHPSLRTPRTETDA